MISSTLNSSNYSFIDKFPLKFNESSFAKKAKKNGNPIKVFNLQS